MSTPPAPVGDPFSGDLPRPTRGSRKTLVIVGALVGFGVAASATVLLLNREPAEPGFRAGDELTSSDGTFTFTLPYGWEDSTVEYRERFAEENGGTESAIEGLAILDGLPVFVSDNFVSMSGHPRSSQDRSAEAIGSEKLEDWRDAFDTVTGTTSSELTTDAGDEVWYGSVTGLSDGEEWRIVLVVVLGEESLAFFDLEIRPEYYEMEADLLESIKTLVFAPAPEVEKADLLWYLPRDDGRVYSSEGGASLVVPTDWTHQETPYEEDAVDPDIPFDFLGIWRIGGSDDQSILEMSSLSLILSNQQSFSPSALEELDIKFGAVGETTSDVNGVEYTVQSIDPFSTPDANDAARITLLTDYDASGEALFEGRIVTRVCWMLLSDGGGLFACLETPEGYDEAMVSQVEDALQTLEFHF